MWFFNKKKKVRWSLSFTGGSFQAAARRKELQKCLNVSLLGGIRHWRFGKTECIQLANETTKEENAQRVLNSTEWYSVGF
jgi:hypothetical protein